MLNYVLCRRFAQLFRLIRLMDGPCHAAATAAALIFYMVQIQYLLKNTEKHEAKISNAIGLLFVTSFFSFLIHLKLML